jgi:hypothetical protein
MSLRGAVATRQSRLDLSPCGCHAIARNDIVDLVFFKLLADLKPPHSKS